MSPSIYHTARRLKYPKVPSTQALGMHSNRAFPRGQVLGSAKGENLARGDMYALLPVTLLILLHPKPSHINTTMVRLNMCPT
jgi:hypothetical protein